MAGNTMPDNLHAPADGPRKRRDRIKAASARILRRLGLWSLWLGVALIFYVLSIGPVVKVAIRNKIPDGVLVMIYAPIIWLGKTEAGGKILTPFFEWYGEKIWKWKDIVAPVG